MEKTNNDEMMKKQTSNTDEVATEQVKDYDDDFVCSAEFPAGCEEVKDKE